MSKTSEISTTVATQDHKRNVKRYLPTHEVIDGGAQWEIHVELPGVAKQDIQLRTNQAQFEITANRGSNPEQWRAISAPHQADVYTLRLQFAPETPIHLAQAKYDLGVLTLRIPKEAPKHRVEIAIE